MNARIQFGFLVAFSVLTGCVRSTIYLKDEYTGFIGAFDTAPGASWSIAAREYRVVQPTKESLAAQDLLHSLKIPKARFEDTTVPEALAMLERIQKEANDGVTLPVKFQEIPGEEYRVKRVSFRIEDATLREVLLIICDQTHLTLGMDGQSAVLFYGSNVFPNSVQKAQ